MKAYRKTEHLLPPLREKIDEYSYANQETIGKGFSSSVYRGRDDRTSQEVAIKIIDMKHIKGEVHKTLLAGEIDILKTIANRPNVLDVLKVHSDKNKTFIITDLCDGGDLGKYIKSKKKLPEPEAIRMIKQIIKGYETLYTMGVVHRDLKPANIFFKNSELKIGDFGFAVKGENLRQVEKYNVGSPVYMPPEALSQNRYSHKSDIWAIGVIFYQMLIGYTPWNGRTEKQLKNKMRTTPIKNLLPKSLSKTSSCFLKKALAVDVHKRLQPYQMFTFFETSHQHDEDETQPEQNVSQQKFNRFRSIRKDKKTQAQLENTTLKSIRVESTNKTKNNFRKLTVSKQTFSQTDLKRQGNVQEKKISALQKRMLSKQLLSQIHLCRFIYKIIYNCKGSQFFNLGETSQQILIKFLFYKLKETQNLTLLKNNFVEQYRQFADNKKLQNLIAQYRKKYVQNLFTEGEELVSDQELPTYYSPEMYATLTNCVAGEIKKLHQNLKNMDQFEERTKQVVIIDYLTTLIQLLAILKNEDLSDFHFKSKIQSIVDGQCIGSAKKQHFEQIERKLLRIGLI